MPFSVSILHAANPSSQKGSLITILSLNSGIFAINASASSTIKAASSAMTSAEIGPSTIPAISLITSAKSRPSLAISEGFVVTPQITPISAALRISSTLAVSMKSFMICSFMKLLGI
jgi:hypothetical protein